MRSIKNISMICLVAMVVLLAFAASPASATDSLPEHSIYIGNTAVSIDYLMNAPAEAQILVNQLVSEQELDLDHLWYQITGEPVKNIGTGADATPEEITEISGALQYWYDAQGVKHDITVTYIVTFTVVDEAEATIADAHVTLGDATMQTNETGVAVFEDVVAADYPYTVSKEDYIAQDGIVTVVDEDVAVPITLVEEPVIIYDVTFTVVDVDEAAIADAHVTLGDATMQTNETGVAVFEDVVAADYPYTVSKEDYIAQDGIVPVADEDVAVPITLDEKADKYIASFDVTTIVLANIADNKVYFTADDQYGEILSLSASLVENVTAEAEYADNQFPLEVVKDYVNGTFTLSDTLVKGKTVQIILTNGDKARDIVNLTVEEIVPEATYIYDITGNSSLTAGGAKETLTANVRDQLGNPYEFTDGEKLRWTTSNCEIVEFDGHRGAGFVDGTANLSTIDIKPRAVGSADILVYLPGGTEVDESFTITVDEGVLNEIDASNADVTVDNMVIPTEANINVNSANTPNITFMNSLGNTLDVPADNVVFTAPDEVAIDKVANGQGALTGIIVSTDGTNQTECAIADNPDSVYEINISVGKIFDNFDVTSEVDTTVTNILTTPIADNVLVVGGTANQTVAFTNANGEFIDIDPDNISATITGNVIIDVLRDVNATTKEVEFTITYKSTEEEQAGTQYVVVKVGSVSNPFEIEIGSESAVKTVDVASTVTVIGKDDYNDDAEVNNTVFIGVKSYEVMPIAFRNQYGNALDVNAKYLNTTDINTTELNIIALTKDGDNWYEKAEDDDLLKAIGVYANLSEDSEETFSVGVTTDMRAADYAPADVTVTVTPERVINDFSLNVDSVDMVINGTEIVYITIEDQYGIPRNVAVLGDINVTSSDASIVTNDSVREQAFGNYTFELTAVSGGDTKVLINITDIKKEIGVSVDTNLANLVVPNLVSGEDDQTFNNLAFTLVGDLEAGENVVIDLSNLAAAGADFSAADADSTVISADNFTAAIADNKITLTVNESTFVETGTGVVISLRDASDNADIIDVATGAAGQYDVDFSRSDSVSVDTKAATIEGNVIDGSATSLNNNDDGQVQDFVFTFDGDFAQNQKFEICVNTGNITYGTDETNDYSVDGASAFVSKVTVNPTNTIISLTAQAAITSGTEVKVSAVRVDTTDIANEGVDVTVTRRDTNNGDDFNFNVGDFVVISPATATVGTTEIRASFLEIANDDNLKFALDAEDLTNGEFEINLTDFTAPFGTKDGGVFVVNGANISKLSVEILDPNDITTKLDNIGLGKSQQHQITKGTYDYIKLNGTAGEDASVSLTYTGNVEDVVGDGPHDVTFVISTADKVNSPVSLDVVSGAKHATKEIILVKNEP